MDPAEALAYASINNYIGKGGTANGRSQGATSPADLTQVLVGYNIRWHGYDQ